MESSPQKNMSINISSNLKDAIETLNKGGIVVTKTDTIYGLLADATNPESVERVYSIKQRDWDKPFIILIPDSKYLGYFNIEHNEKGERLLNNRGITVVFKIKNSEKFDYLHRGTKKLAFRIPDDTEFLNFIKELGKPVVAPSANPSGLEPAKNIQQAIEYFTDKVDMYIDRGEVISNVPSTIVEVDNGKIKIIRLGSKTI